MASMGLSIASSLIGNKITGEVQKARLQNAEAGREGAETAPLEG